MKCIWREKIYLYGKKFTWKIIVALVFKIVDSNIYAKKKFINQDIIILFAIQLLWSAIYLLRNVIFFVIF